MNTQPDESLPTPLAPSPDAGDAGDAQFEAPATALCANCSTPLLGAHCYACGQPVKGMVRHLSSVMADAADTILNIDSRIFRTLWPLFTRPGFLTTEYFAGRRVRYVTPFRLYFFLSIAAFFLIQFALGDVGMNSVRADESGGDSITHALTAAEVIKQRDAAVAGLKKTEDAPLMPAVANKGIEKAVEAIQKKAEKRLDYLRKVDEARAKGETPPADPSTDEDTINFGNSRWDPKTNPVNVSWLPQIGNDKLNQLMIHARENLNKISKDPKPFVIGAVGVLPQVLFVLMPLFALMLKIFYVFKRRLYMEHLIVALHSHSFIFVSLLLLTLVGMTGTWAAKSAPWLSTPLGWATFALGWWLPIYLLLMQKKVYKQGWIMTLLKFSTIGIGYMLIVTFGIIAAILVSLATT